MLPHGNDSGPVVRGAPAAPSAGRPAPGASRRRFLTTLAGAGAAVASPALLTGCGTAQAKGGAMQFWNFYGPQRSPDPAVRAQSKWFVDLVDQWNASHPVKIELVYLPNATYLNGFKLPSSFASGAGPDIFLLSPGDFLRYLNGGVLADLTPHLDKGVVEDYGTALDSRMVDGKVYALPMEVEPLAMYYSVDAWEKAGLSEGDIPTTWDRMLDIGDKLRTRTRAGLVFETNRDQPRLLPELHLVPVDVAGRRRRAGRAGQRHVRLQGHPAGAGVVAGRGTARHRATHPSRRR
jgi:multiple sugar transport system substrate-binding protein